MKVLILKVVTATPTLPSKFFVCNTTPREKAEISCENPPPMRRAKQHGREWCATQVGNEIGNGTRSGNRRSYADLPENYYIT